MTPNPEISVVIPLKDEEQNVRPLLEELRGVLDGLGLAWEVIAVDDGSSDGTWEILLGLREATPGLRLVRLDRNYGQSTGFWAGLKRVRGQIAIMMDGDMQNDPRDIPKMLAEIAKGADVCLTWRANRQDTKWKKIQSRIGNGFRNRFLESDIRDTGSQLRAFRSKCLEDLPRFDGMHRFMGNLFLMRGFQIVQIPTNHRARRAGTTKYGMANRAIRGLKDLFGVRWLKQRVIKFGVEQEHD
ncbi:glycosyltransferase family 2 protein [bacterium]|nr:glycosyltransferase family 2 protein [bacterium]